MISKDKITIAKNIHGIIRKIIKGIDQNGVTTNLDFSDVELEQLKDFWLYASGFISMSNKSYLEKVFPSRQIDSIIQGKFFLKSISFQQAQNLVKAAKKPRIKQNKPTETKVFSIQDGTYIVHSGEKDPTTGESINYITLETNPLQITGKAFDSSSHILLTLRNIFAHSTPVIDGNNIIFDNGANKFVVSKMWLRGFCELFSQNYNPLNCSELIEAMSNYQKKAKKNLLSPDDIPEFLESAKHLFPEHVQEEFQKVISFIKNRIQYNHNFFSLSEPEKIESLAAMCNSGYSNYTVNYGISNPQTMFDLLQLLSREIEKQQLGSASFDNDDEKIIKYKELTDKIDNIDARIKLLTTVQTNPNLNSLNKQRAKLMSQLESLISEMTQQVNSVATNIDFLNSTPLNALNIEAAVNLVYLMAYNNLVVSGFYEDVLRYVNLGDLNETQYETLLRFNMGNICAQHNDNEPGLVFSAKGKGFALYTIRNAICHGTFGYSIPQAKNGEQPFIKDIMLTFTSPDKSWKYFGTLGDFYGLFLSETFFKKRTADLISTDQYVVFTNNNGVPVSDLNNISPQTDENNDDNDDENNK